MEPQPFFLIVMKKVLYIKLFNKTRKLIVNYFKFFFSFVSKKKRMKKLGNFRDFSWKLRSLREFCQMCFSGGIGSYYFEILEFFANNLVSFDLLYLLSHGNIQVHSLLNIGGLGVYPVE